MKVKAVYLFSNGMIVTFDTNNKQVPQLQGRNTPELIKEIKNHSDEKNKWNGFQQAIEWSN